jgi:hypothetical protein
MLIPILCVEQAEAAIDEFVTKNKPVPFHLRRHIREVQDFAPRAATVSRELSLHLFDTKRKNIICLYHQRHRTTNYLTDGFVPGKSYILRGIPYPRTVKTAKGAEPPAGHLNCGCSVDVALLDFFWWKTWVLDSTRPNLAISEGLKDECISPRVRAFFAQAFIEATGMNIDDLYASGVGVSGFNMKAMRMFQLRRMLQLVNEMNAQDNSPLLTIGCVVPNDET